MTQVPADPPTIKFGVSGRFRVKLIDRQGRVVREHEQDNLILDQGLDWMMSNASGNKGLRVGLALQYVAVGTDSTAPDVTDVALGNEIARTNSALTFGAGDDRPTEVSTGVAKLMRRFAFDFNQANGNLTELGISPTASGNLCTRALFMDGATPVTITKTSSEQLVIEYELRVTVTPTSETASDTITITGLGTRDTSIAFAKQMIYYNDYRDSYWGCVWGGNGGPGYYTAAMNMSYSNFQALTLGSSIVVSTYVPGDFYKDWTFTIPATGSDVTVYGYGWGHSYSGYSAAFKIKLDTSIVKDKAYKLVLSFRLSLART